MVHQHASPMAAFGRPPHRAEGGSSQWISGTEATKGYHKAAHVDQKGAKIKHKSTKWVPKWKTKRFKDYQNEPQRKSYEKESQKALRQE
jgi:hypothetical protein